MVFVLPLNQQKFRPGLQWKEEIFVPLEREESKWTPHNAPGRDFVLWSTNLGQSWEMISNSVSFLSISHPLLLHNEWVRLELTPSLCELTFLLRCIMYTNDGTLRKLLF